MSFSTELELSLNELRKAYQAAVENADLADRLWKRIRRFRQEEGIYVAYKAATRILLANFSWAPLTKLAYVKEAMSLFRKAVQLDPENPEIRFLRYSIQHSLPAYLNEARDMPADKALVLSKWTDYEAFALRQEDLKEMLDFFRRSGRFTHAELKELSGVISD